MVGPEGARWRGERKRPEKLRGPGSHPPLSATVKGSLSLSQRGAQGGLVIELCDLPWVSAPPSSFSSPSVGPMQWTVVVTKLHLLKLLDLYA